MSRNEIISYEFNLYFANTQEYIKERILCSNKYCIWMYIKYLRKEEYYRNKVESNKVFLLPLVFYRRKKNIIGRKLCFDIPGGVFAPGLLIYHPGPIAINPYARVGENATIVGTLCIGNNNGVCKAPQIGKNCTFGWGSTLIGEIRIGDNCKVGANAFVNKSFEENGAVLVGTPAFNIREK